MGLFGRKKKVRDDRTEKQILISEMKELVRKLQEKEKALAVDRERFLREAEKAKDAKKAKEEENEKLAADERRKADLRAVAIEWAKKSIDGLVKCIDEYSIVLPVRAGSNGQLYHDRVKTTVKELTEFMDRVTKWDYFYEIQEKIYPLVERLALEITDCAKI